MVIRHKYTVNKYKFEKCSFLLTSRGLLLPCKKVKDKNTPKTTTPERTLQEKMIKTKKTESRKLNPDVRGEIGLHSSRCLVGVKKFSRKINIKFALECTKCLN